MSPVGMCLKNDEGPDRDILTGDKIIAVRILTEADAACRTGTDPSIRSGVICRCGTQIIRAGCTAGVNAGDVRQIVVAHIRNKKEAQQRPLLSNPAISGASPVAVPLFATVSVPYLFSP